MRFAGYFTGVMGTGEHARQLAVALRAQGIGVTTTTLHGPGALEDEELRDTAVDGRGPDEFADFNLLSVNADSVAPVAEQLGEAFFAGRYTIGFWAWEVDAFPSRFLPAFAPLDEVWVGSRHVRDAVAQIAPVPVTAIPQPVSLPVGAAESPPPEGLPAGFTFLFAFDYLSVFERKNPLGTVEAFARAFAPGSGASLVVKTLNEAYNPAAHERLRAAAAAHPDIHLIERRLTRSERDGLMNAADCYVSLHRAEGFGYTLAESMWLCKPVIATGYSGNTDFMTSENSYLVSHRLVPIGPGSDPYPPEGMWAEPDIGHAARLMRDVFENRDAARNIGRRAGADIRATHAPEVSGAAMRERLRLVLEARPRTHRAAPQRGVDAELKTLRERVQMTLAPPAPTPSRSPRRLARRTVRKLLRPALTHQHSANEALLDALRSLRADVQSLGSSDQDVARRIDELPARGRAPERGNGSET